MRTSHNGLLLIEKHEGCYLTSYLCPAGVWTVGIGHTRTAKQGITITKKQAYDLLQSDLEIAESIVLSSLQGLNQNQFDALVSLVFNIGGGNFRSSTLLKKIKQNAPESEIREQFAAWVYAKHKRLPGLVTRRLDESNLFFE